MKYLHELAQVVTSYRLDNVAAFNVYNRRDEDSLYNKFLNGIVSNRFESDNEAAAFLYNTTDKDVKYRVLKKRLKERIYNNILFMDSGKRAKSKYFSVYHTIYRHYIVSKFLIGVGAKASGIELMEKVMLKAQKYQLFDVVQQCALQLRRQYMLIGDQKKFTHFNKQFAESNARLLSEAKTEELYYIMGLSLNTSLAIPKNLIVKAQQAAEITQEQRNLYPTFNNFYHHYNVQTTYYQLVKNYKAAIETCDSFHAYLNKNPIFDTQLRRAHIDVTKTSCYLQLGEYKKGLPLAKKSVGKFTSGTINWYLVMELYFLLALNEGNYNLATDLYIGAIEHEKFSSQPPQRQEIWKIFGGYLYFMLTINNSGTDLERLNHGHKSFRFAKLLNEVPVFARDKKGMNVAILILQILLLLQKKDYLRITSRTEALQLYTYRNLQKEEAFRSHQFIKMLITMEQNHFKGYKTREKTKKMLEKLKDVDLSYTNTQARMEVIPYERLWNIILKMTD